MKKYQEYRQTGLSWLPIIPAHWEWRYLSQTADDQLIKNDNEVRTILSLSYGNIIRKKNVSSGLVPSNYEGYQVVLPENIILRLTDLQNDHTSLRTGLVKEEGIITSAYTCLKPMGNSEFLHYLLHAYDIRKVFYGMGGGVRQSIAYKDIRNLRCPFPPREEQRIIVNYLNWKSSEINLLIAAKKKQVACLFELIQLSLYSEDASISEIKFFDEAFPKDWKKLKAKYIFHERNEKGFTDKELLAVTQDRGVLYKKDCPQNYVLPNDLSKQKLVCGGDYVISLRSFQGGIEYSKISGLVSAAYSVFSIDDEYKEYKEFFELLFKTKPFILYLNSLVKDIRDGKKIGFNDFKRCILPLPPKSLIDKLHNMKMEYDALVDELGKTKITLNELKARIIYAVVTGEMDVRDVEVPEFEYVEEIEDSSDEDEETDDESVDEEV